MHFNMELRLQAKLLQFVCSLWAKLTARMR